MLIARSLELIAPLVQIYHVLMPMMVAQVFYLFKMEAITTATLGAMAILQTMHQHYQLAVIIVLSQI